MQIPTHQRLFIRCKKTSYSFLVDTGSDLSILPNNILHRKRIISSTLFAANGSPINTYGKLRATVHLPHLPPYEWDFTIADIHTAILGADFLRHFGLLVDLQNQRLIDSHTQTFIKGVVPLASSQESCLLLASAPQRFSKLLANYKPSSQPKGAPIFHHIVTTGPPCFSKPRRLAPHLYEKTRAHFQEMLDSGIIRPSKSDWSTPLHVVTKPNGDVRPLGDYRFLNRITTADQYPIPHLHDFTYNLHGSTVFSTFDLTRAFFHCRIAPEDVHKTAITTEFGKFEFLRMNYGLRNAPQTWQRYMDYILRDLPFTYVYLDDILVSSPNMETHYQHVQLLLATLSSFGLNINTAKCQLAKSQVTFLGHLVDSTGISPLPEKMELIRKFPLPVTVNDLRTFLGLINFYRRTIPNAAHCLMKITQLLPSDAKKNDRRRLTWSKVNLQHFKEAKDLINTTVTLAHPHPHAPLLLETNTTDLAIGATLYYEQNKQLYPIGYFSKALSPSQRKYTTFDRELLAIYLSVIHFRQIIEGRPLQVSTTHKPLTTALTSIPPSSSSMRLRHVRFISEFVTKIVYRTTSRQPPQLHSTTSLPEFSPAKLCREQQLDPHIANLDLTSINYKGITLLCDVSQTNPRPYIPSTLRPHIFKLLHGTSHPSMEITTSLITQRYYWPRMTSSIKEMIKACPSCTPTNDAKPTHAVIKPNEPLKDIILDVVGPLLQSNGFKHCLILIDKNTGWFETAPIRKVDSPTIIKLISEQWISRFGVPESITSNSNIQICSNSFKSFCDLNSITYNNKNAFDGNSNKFLERIHHILKNAILTAAKSTKWASDLPSILLGLRNRPSAHGYSPSQLLYNMTPRLPNEMFNPSSSSLNPKVSYSAYRKFTQGHLPSTMNSATHVYVQASEERLTLAPPYLGPFIVLSNDGQTVVYQDIVGKQQKIPVDRCRPAHSGKAFPTSSQLPPTPSTTLPALQPHELSSVHHERPSRTTTKRSTDLPRSTASSAAGIIAGRSGHHQEAYKTKKARAPAKRRFNFYSGSAAPRSASPGPNGVLNWAHRLHGGTSTDPNVLHSAIPRSMPILLHSRYEQDHYDAYWDTDGPRSSVSGSSCGTTTHSAPWTTLRTPPPFPRLQRSPTPPTQPTSFPALQPRLREAAPLRNRKTKSIILNNKNNNNFLHK